YHEGDRGTIAFRRYTNHLIEPVIWFNDLVYDHPARDLAEFIRNRFLHVDEGEEEIALFLEDYQTEMPISVFGWRQIDRKSTRLNSSHVSISYAVFCL